MGGPKPWPTRWPEPDMVPLTGGDEYYAEPMGDPDYDIEVDPREEPFRLPEEMLAPYSVTWGVTQRCNLHCDHCYDAVCRERDDLSTDQALDAIDRLAAMDISFIAFSGGEPMMRPDLYQLIERCRLEGIAIALRSNATLITPQRARWLAELEVQVVGVSLDGATEPAHDAVRGRGAFRRMRDGVRALLAEGIRVNLEVVLRSSNVHHGLQFVALAEEWGVDEVNFAALAPQGRGSYLGDEVLDQAARRQVSGQLCAASKEARIAVTPSCTLVGRCWACVEPNVTCDGWVTPCYLSSHRLFRLLETDPAEAEQVLRHHRPSMVHACRHTPGVLWEGTSVAVLEVTA